MSGFGKYLLLLFIPLIGLGQNAIKCPSNLKAAQPSNNKGGKRLTISAFKSNKKSGGSKNTLAGGDSKAPRTKRAFLSKLYGKNVYKNNTGTVESGVLSGRGNIFNKDNYGDAYNSSLTVKGNKKVKEKRVIASWFKKGDVYKENYGEINGSSLKVKGNIRVKEKRVIASWFKKGDVYKENYGEIDGSSLKVKGNIRVKEKRVIASWFKKGDVYKENVGAVEGAAFTVKGNEPVRTKRKLASRFSKKPKYKYSQSTIADALSSKPESKKKKEKRIKQARNQKDLFEPGILKTSKFPRD